MGFIPENVIVNLKKEIAESGGAAVESLTTRVQTLETTVGDETGGLVKDVDDLETVVGDSSGGLVKDVDELLANEFSIDTLEGTTDTNGRVQVYNGSDRIPFAIVITSSVGYCGLVYIAGANNYYAQITNLAYTPVVSTEVSGYYIYKKVVATP